MKSLHGLPISPPRLSPSLVGTRDQTLRRPTQTIHNPGTVPDPDYAMPGPDITTIFETGYKDYQDREVQKRISDLLRYSRDRCCYMVLSVPRADVDALVPELKRRAKYVFVTESKKGWYEKFSDGWERFVAAMARDA